MKLHTLTLKIINDQDALDSLSMSRPLSEPQKNLIRFIARTAIEEYIQAEKLDPKTQQQDRVLRLPEVVKHVALSRSTIYMRVSNGTFPSPSTLALAVSDGRKVKLTLGLTSEKTLKLDLTQTFPSASFIKRNLLYCWPIQAGTYWGVAKR